MIFWVVGIVITFITRKLLGGYWEKSFVEQRETKERILLHILALVCIILVGGIAVAKFVGMFWEFPFWGQMIIGIVPALFTYVVGFYVLGLFNFEDIRSHCCFIIVFIVSILGWTILINDYNRNIEKVTETVIEQTQTRELLYFCNVPVQGVTGEISGNSSILGGSISGNIDTTHELTYWYANEENSALFDTAPANSSEIEFLEEKEEPYVEIVYYYQVEKRIDHNIEFIGFEVIDAERRWKQYIFYLPQSIMQYTLN